MIFHVIKHLGKKSEYPCLGFQKKIENFLKKLFKLKGFIKIFLNTKNII